MKSERLVLVGIAEAKVIQKPGILVSYALGSCVGICLYGRRSGVAGLAHILLPCRQDALQGENPFKFADSGTQALLQMMIRAGASEQEIVAKIVGGARMFPTNGASEAIGERNVRACKEALLHLGIPLEAEDTGKDYGRTIRFNSENGRLEISSAKRQSRLI